MKYEIIDSLILCSGSQTELFKTIIILVLHAAHHKLNYMPYPYIAEFSNCLIFFSLIFMLKFMDEPFRNQDSDPWIFLRIRIQEAKYCGSNGFGS